MHVSYVHSTHGTSSHAISAHFLVFMAMHLTVHDYGTVRCIKKLTFYARLTTTGMGGLRIRVCACYGTSTGVASAMLFQSKSKQDGNIRSAIRFRTLVGSRIDVQYMTI